MQLLFCEDLDITTYMLPFRIVQLGSYFFERPFKVLKTFISSNSGRTLKDTKSR